MQHDPTNTVSCLSGGISRNTERSNTNTQIHNNIDKQIQKYIVFACLKIIKKNKEKILTQIHKEKKKEKILSPLVWGNIDKYKTIFKKKCANKQKHKYTNIVILPIWGSIKKHNTHLHCSIILHWIPVQETWIQWGFKGKIPHKKGFLENCTGKPCWELTLSL